ncbi:MAG: DUF4236 domain-containing protein [Clostridiales bacterium]|nr:DUF4236 domain-containing protein [Clostridiales bacterium]
MGLYFRKSKSVGPFRLNFSKSGVGVSTGVKGARVSFGPRGTYVHLGRHGLYYRQKIGNRKNGIRNNQSGRVQAYKPPIDTEEGEDAIRVTDASQDSALGKEILKSISKSRFIFFVWLFISIVISVWINVWGLIISVLVGVILWRFFSAPINCDLDEYAESEWKKLTDVLCEVSCCQKVWIVETSLNNRNVKVNAGAQRSVTRGNAVARLLSANAHTGFRVKVDVPTFILNSKKCRVLFFPGGILVKKAGKIRAYSYEQIELVSSTINFVESGKLCSDALVVDQTWQYVNANGSPDKRFNNNRQIPICLYGLLLVYGEGLRIDFETSDHNALANIDEAYQNYKSYMLSLRDVELEIVDNESEQHLEDNHLADYPQVDNQAEAEKQKEEAERWAAILEQKKKERDDFSEKFQNGAKATVSVAGNVMGWIVSIVLLLFFLLLFIAYPNATKASDIGITIVSQIVSALQVIIINPILSKLIPSVPFLSWIKRHRIISAHILLGVWFMLIVIVFLVMPTPT